MSHTQSKTRSALHTLALLGLFATNMVWAQAEPMTIVIGYAAGGPTDVVARKLAAALQEQSRRTVVVENRPGVAGGLAANFVANAANDGNTVFLHNSYAQNAKTATLEPVVQIADTALGLWAKPNARPSTANIAFGGTPAAFAFLYGNKAALDQWARTSVMPVPYRGSAPALADTASGQTDYFLGELSSGDAAARAGLVLVASSSARVAQALGFNLLGKDKFDVPEFAIPLGIFVPAGTADLIKSRLRANVFAAVKTPEFKTVLQSSFLLESVRTPEVFTIQMNEFSALAKRAIDAGADIPSTAPLGSTASNPPRNSISPPQQTANDDPKVFGRSARGG